MIFIVFFKGDKVTFSIIIFVTPPPPPLRACTVTNLFAGLASSALRATKLLVTVTVIRLPVKGNDKFVCEVKQVS